MSPLPAVATFMFHEVTDDPTSSGFQRPGAIAYKHGTSAFTEHLTAIAAGPVSPTLVTGIDLAVPGRHVLLTFDDGGVSALTAAAMLEERGWKGHFFIVTDRIGTRGFLSADQLQRLRRAGHTIGSHSHSHPSIFRELPVARMVEEWRGSSDLLAQLLGEPCLSASVPGGDISRRVLESAGAAGLRYLFTSEPWLAPRRVDGCWALGRFSVKVSTPPENVRALAQFQGWTNALIRRRMKVLATRALPPLYRLYIRARTRERTPS
jgi:peptidoglycan/xylan/chitin deacetylase (PgdA/CDA1 family)